MKCLLHASAFLAVVSLSPTFAQNPAPPDESKPKVVMTKLSPPVYPLAAWESRIMGRVKIRLVIQRDGGIVSSEIASGHPLLSLAALDSARGSQVQCSGCADESLQYVLTFSFELQSELGCPTEPPRTPAVTISGDTVRIAAAPKCIVVTNYDPPSTFVKRSAKCLYLWKCGRR